MSIHALKDAVESFAPAGHAESWDNTGVLIDSGVSYEAPRVLITIDLTVHVLEECLRLKCNYILAYHPVIFHPIKAITDPVYVACIRNGISVYSPHTQLDPLMSDYIRGLLGESASFRKAVEVLKGATKLRTIRGVSPREDREYKTDGDMLIGVGAAFRGCTASEKLVITGEMAHHDLLACKRNGSVVILLEHSNSERIFLGTLKKRLEEDENMKNYVFLLSEADCDPVEFL